MTASKPNTVRSRARGPAPTPQQVRAARVETIILMMKGFSWRRGKSGPELAKEWGIALDTVEKMSAEASRAVARDLEPDALGQDIKLRMHEIVKHGEPRDATKAAAVAASLLGLNAAQRIELSSARAVFEALPPAEQAKELRAKSAELILAAESIEADIKLGLPTGTVQAVAVHASRIQ